MSMISISKSLLTHVDDIRKLRKLSPRGFYRELTKLAKGETGDILQLKNTVKAEHYQGVMGFARKIVGSVQLFFSRIAGKFKGLEKAVSDFKSLAQINKENAILWAEGKLKGLKLPDDITVSTAESKQIDNFKKM